MSDEIIRKKKFENFLRVLKKEGYPNSNIEDLAKLVDYNLAYFLIDFVESMGMNKTEEFIGQGLNKLIGPEKKVRIVLPEHFGVGSFSELKVKNFYIDLDDTADGIRLDAQFGDTVIEDFEGILRPLSTIYHEIGMGEMGDFEELLESLEKEFADWFHERLGYYIYWN